MAPGRRDFSQRRQYERPLLHSRMRHRHLTKGSGQIAYRDNVEIQRPRSPTLAPFATEARFDATKFFVELLGAEIARVQLDDGVEVVVLAALSRPRFGLPDARSGHDR